MRQSNLRLPVSVPVVQLTDLSSNLMDSPGARPDKSRINSFCSDKRGMKEGTTKAGRMTCNYLGTSIALYVSEVSNRMYEARNAITFNNDYCIYRNSGNRQKVLSKKILRARRVNGLGKEKDTGE